MRNRSLRGALLGSALVAAAFAVLIWTLRASGRERASRGGGVGLGWLLHRLGLDSPQTFEMTHPSRHDVVHFGTYQSDECCAFV
jgi:hypothetical protein